MRAMHTTFVNHPVSRRNHSNMIRTLSPKCVFMGQIPQSHMEVHNWYRFIRRDLKQYTTCAARMQTNNQGTSSGYANFEVFNPVLLRIPVFWDMVLRHWVISSRRFKRTYQCHIQPSSARMYSSENSVLVTDYPVTQCRLQKEWNLP
jgi:hypothetical protein